MNDFISIIIPAHNEEIRIGPTLEAYGKFFTERLKEKRIRGYEILVVLNACKDNTLAIVKSYSKKYSYIRWLNYSQAGKGFAIIEGFKNVKGDLLGFVDADMATSPEAFYNLVLNIDGCDGIVASRYIKGSIVDPKPIIQRIIVSRIFNFLIRILFLLPYKDTQCGAKLFKRSAIEKVIQDLVITKWAFDVDLLYCLKKNKFKIREFPTVWSDKKYSTINFKKAGPLMALAVIRLRMLNSPLKDFIKIYDNMPEWLKVYHRIFT